MELIADYIKDDRYLEKLNDLTNEVFGFSFEDWVKNGYYTGEYIPYSFLEDGKIVSNVSANIMKFKYNNEIKNYIQIGTVMTSYSFRNRSLASKLMKYVIEEYKDKCDAIYLFGDLKALEFYKKLGFTVINQYRYNLKKEYVGKIINNKNQLIQVNKDNISLKNLFIEYIKKGISYGNFEQINRFGLTMFYCQYFEDVYYIDNLDVFVVLELDNNKLIIKSIIGKNDVSLEEIIANINIPYSYLELGFTPLETDMYLFDCSLFDGGEDYRLFILGDDLKIVEEKKLLFPLLSHA